MLGYGLRRDPAAGAEVAVYDPNHPGDDSSGCWSPRPARSPTPAVARWPPSPWSAAPADPGGPLPDLTARASSRQLPALLGPQPRVVPVPQPGRPPAAAGRARPPGGRTARRRRPRRPPRSPAPRRAGSPGTGTARPARRRPRRPGRDPAAGLPQPDAAQAGGVHHRAAARAAGSARGRWWCAGPCRSAPTAPTLATSAPASALSRLDLPAPETPSSAAVRPGRRWPRSSSSPRPSTVLVSSTGAASAASATSSRSVSAVRAGRPW